MASAGGSSPLMSSDHVKAAVTEFGTIFISYFSAETNYELVETNNVLDCVSRVKGIEKRVVIHVPP